MEKIKIGTILSLIRGINYCITKPIPSEGISFIREPNNKYDKNAIRAENSFGEKIGYIAEENSKWLAPLIDGKFININGTISKHKEKINRYVASIIINVYPMSNFEKLLQQDNQVLTLQDGFYNVIKDTFLKASHWEQPLAISKVGSELRKFAGLAGKPEAYLLSRMMPGIAYTKKVEISERYRLSIKSIFRSLDLDNPIKYKNVSIIPVNTIDKSTGKYLTIGKALKKQLAVVKEVDEEGKIGQLLVENNSEEKIIIPEGTIFVGGKQDRCAAYTSIINHGSVQHIKVYCIERIRWSRRNYYSEKSEFNISTNSLTGNVRYRKYADECEYGIEKNMQNTVWDSITSELNSKNIQSSTENINDFTKKKDKRLKKLYKKINLSEKCCGLMIFINGKFVSFEIFSSVHIFKEYQKRIISSVLYNRVYTKKAGKIINGHKKFKQIRKTLCDYKKAPLDFNSQHIEVFTDKLMGYCFFDQYDLTHMALLGKFR